MALSIINRNAPLGAEIKGIDLAEPMTPSDLRAMQMAWLTRLVIVGRGQRLSDPALLAFSRQFGELDPPGPNPHAEPFNKEFPEINVISNVFDKGKPIGKHRSLWPPDPAG